MFHLTPDTDQFAAFFRLIRSECEWPNGGAIAISGNENLVTLSAAIRKVRVGQNSAISDCVGTHLEVSHHQFHCLKWKSSESYCRACKLELSLESRVDWLRKNNLSCVFLLGPASLSCKRWSLLPSSGRCLGIRLGSRQRIFPPCCRMLNTSTFQPWLIGWGCKKSWNC